MANANLAQLIRSFPHLKVAVLGDVMVDVYLEGTARRLCREAPVPAVDVERRHDEPGGAANTAANVRALGAAVALLGVIGDDLEGHALRETLRHDEVDDDALVPERDRRTIAKQRVVAQGQLLLRVDHGDTSAVDAATQERLLARLEAAYEWADALIVSDYGYGTLTTAVLDRIGVLQRRAAKPVVVDAKDGLRYAPLGVTAVKPNYEQAMRWLGLQPVVGERRVAQITEYGDDLLALSGAQVVAVTLDVDGALVFERDAPPYRTFAKPERQSRSTGAGDTFASALALALAAGGETAAAAELASAAAGVVVAKDSTARCSAFELRQRLFADDKVIRDGDRLRERAEYLHRQGRRIVFTNGVFDILHRGHVAYLNRAKMLGDVLIVGVNGDESVRRLKGPERPVNALDDRMQVLAGLSGVDHIVPFDGDTPVELIRAVRPHVFVKGGDYHIDHLPEAPVVRDLGGSITILPLVPDRSTTHIIARIQAAAAAAEDPETWQEAS
jgi:D-beta-D-heptose 7-phosphate kinase / D-beta-D-heptose 1-phosphate adenosyltransferase